MSSGGEDFVESLEDEPLQDVVADESVVVNVESSGASGSGEGVANEESDVITVDDGIVTNTLLNGYEPNASSSIESSTVPSQPNVVDSIANGPQIPVVSVGGLEDTVGNIHGTKRGR